MPQHSIENVPIPHSLDEPGASDFIAGIELGMRMEAEQIGTTSLAYTPAEVLPWWHRSWEPRELWVVRSVGRIVGSLELSWELENDETVSLYAAVEPEYQSRGIGTAFLAHAISRARALGRTTLQTYSVELPSSSGERLLSPTGFGSVDASRPAARFLTGAQFRLGQVDRVSRLALPADDVVLDRAWASAAEAAADYRLVRWVGSTPSEHLEAIARLSMEIQTDAPAGELDAGSTDWDAAKIAEDDATKEGRPVTRLIVLALHRSGDVAGYTELAAPHDRTRAVKQGDTVVMRAHRGHRLGMLLKLANIRHLAEVAPGHPSIVTYNAEENRHMLSVNEAVGFAPSAYEGGWRRDL
jgi:GNAT superfamily N-acetyltransferase